MNWVEGAKEWGTVTVPDALDYNYKSKKISENEVCEIFTFTNKSDVDVFTSKTDIGIYITFNDSYGESKVCIEKRCNTHIYCGGKTSYVLALRMGGEAPHLGMVLTKGSLCGYSVERNIEDGSNDRGDFIMHPSPVHLLPGESFSVEWTLFFCENEESFYQRLPEYTEFIKAEADKYIIQQGEDICVKFTPEFSFSEVKVTCNGEKTAFSVNDNAIYIKQKANCIGECSYHVVIGQSEAYCVVSVVPKFMELAEKRADFLIRHQQFHNADSNLNGAFLTYDNEEGHLFCSPQNDYNGGRERVGMCVFLAKWARITNNADAIKAVKEYLVFVEREIFDIKTGMIFNNIGYDNSFPRLYNAPWFAVLYLECYRLFEKKEYLIYAYKILLKYYIDGGTEFYPIMLPATEAYDELIKAGMNEYAASLLPYYRKHADFIERTGKNYPPSEVKFEQSIIAPAADCSYQYAKIFNEERYYASAEEHLKLLMLMNGKQPDYHLYETAIRHWDGYWFGKNKLYGDTFPHYWSGLTGMAVLRKYEITKDNSLVKKAYHSIMGTLTLIMPDGRGSCAYLFPLTVNGVKAQGFDPYANDQDWALYFMLLYMDKLNNINEHGNLAC